MNSSPFVRVGVYAPNGEIHHVCIRADDIRAFHGATLSHIEYPDAVGQPTLQFPQPRACTKLVVVHSHGTKPDALWVCEPIDVFMSLMVTVGQHVVKNNP